MKYEGVLREYEDMKPGLSRIRNLLKALGNPQKTLKYIHIAGTNGKGSTAYYIAEILKENGYKTALYTSPHLLDITERIKINGKNISAKIFDSLFKKHLSLSKKYGLSFFEYITALSFVFFAKQKADIAVLETGLGGRFDATNIIEKPLICIISSISYDHKAVLGNSIKKIAFEKAGIIKAGAKTIVSNLHQDALDIISKKTCPYIFGSDFKVSNISFKYGVPKFDYSFTDKTILKNIRLQNFGFHQIQNASLSLCAADLLKQKGFILKEAQIKKALYNVKVAARFDLRNLKIKGQKIKLIIDGAHNEEALKAFVSQWRSLKLKKGVFIFAIMKDKEYKKTVKILAPMAKQIILPKLKSQRALMPAILKKEFSKYISNSNIAIAASVKDALTLLKKTDICAAVGSLYLAGEVFENTKLKI